MVHCVFIPISTENMNYKNTLQLKYESIDTVQNQKGPCEKQIIGIFQSI